MINREILEGNWNQLKGKLRHKWGQLTESDLAHFHGNIDELVGVIQQKTGEGREAVEGFLKELTESAGSFAGQAAETARHYAGQASEAIRDTANKAADQWGEGVEGVKCMLHDRPGQTLAICFGLGLLVGLLVSKTCCHK
jgi:uncharacterized protein YjbJ (UPF0337 family)